MKTAMQELIHDFKYGKFNLLSNSKIDSELEKYLEKEKQQIVDAYNKGMIPEPYNLYFDGKDYYNNTFNQHQ